ncbi:MAG: T9SS type A sorting domain-containing protein [Bacteroidota bacterium]
MGGGVGDFVNASTVYNGELIVGGRFTSAGGVPANYIAKWNGTSWSALGTGLDGWVNALTDYNGELIAGGSFTNAGGMIVNNIARWNGSTWNKLGSGTGWATYSLINFGSDLIVGGLFSTPGGIDAPSIARWDGSAWHPLGSGMGPTPIGDRYVFAMAVYRNNLYAGGEYLTAGGIVANGMAKWDGSSWSEMNGGVTLAGSNSYGVYTLTVYGGDLIAGGAFDVAGGVNVGYLARWNEPYTGIGPGMKTGETPEVYPNPCSSGTKLSFDISENTFTELIIYDTRGIEAAPLVSAVLTPEKYDYQWNTTNYPAGVYYYRLSRTPGNSVFGKIVVINQN